MWSNTFLLVSNNRPQSTSTCLKFYTVYVSHQSTMLNGFVLRNPLKILPGNGGNGFYFFALSAGAESCTTQPCLPAAGLSVAGVCLSAQLRELVSLSYGDPQELCRHLRVGEGDTCILLIPAELSPPACILPGEEVASLSLML